MRKSIYMVLTMLWMVLFLLPPLPIMAQEMSLEQGLNEITAQISGSISPNKTRTIAVIDFNDLQGGVTLLGRFIGEELVTKFVQTNQFKVIERSLLEKALHELKFNSSDLVDPSVAKQLGKVVGADAIVTGTLTELGQSIKINARIITVESGEIIGAASALIVKDSTIEGMLKGTVGSGTTSIDSSTNKHYTKSSSISSSVQDITPGMRLEFQDQVFEVNDLFRVSLVSIEFIDKNRPKVTMTIENLTNYTQRFMLTKPQQFSYITNQTGDAYIFKEATQISYKEEKQIPTGIPIKFSMTFAEVSPTTQKVSVVIRLYYSAKYKNYDITFRDLSLHN